MQCVPDHTSTPILFLLIFGLVFSLFRLFYLCLVNFDTFVFFDAHLYVGAYKQRPTRQRSHREFRVGLASVFIRWSYSAIANDVNRENFSKQAR